MSYLEVVVAVAKALAEEEEKRQETIELNTRLRRESDRVIRKLSKYLDAKFSEAKLERCQNRLASLTRLFEEYLENKQDKAKLSAVERECQYCLDTLDDDDIRLPGATVYAGLATLRIAALKLKAKVFENDIHNAAELARDCHDYMSELRDLMLKTAKSRVGLAVAIVLPSFGEVLFMQPMVMIDKEWVTGEPSSIGRPGGDQRSREKKIEELRQRVQVRADEMKQERLDKILDRLKPTTDGISEVIVAWKAFADQNA